MTHTAAPPPEPLPRRVAVLGFARSGRALAEALVARGVAVAVGDSRPEAEFDGLEALRSRGVRFFFGGPAPELLAGAEWLAVSPGVPLVVPAVQQARALGIPVLSEIEAAYRIAELEAPGMHRWIAITGTNGKSTTTTWIAEVLKRAGRPAVLAGNIGAPLSGFLSEPGPRDFVCELSSFQLEGVDRFRPHVAVLTNITPDHLDRYAGFAEYAAAKARVFARQGPDDFAVVNADDAASRTIPTAARRVQFSRRGRPEGAGPAAWLEAGELVADVAAARHGVLAARRLALPGTHNLENALATLAAAECLAVARRGHRRRAGALRGPSAPHADGGRGGRRALGGRLEGHERGRDPEVARRPTRRAPSSSSSGAATSTATSPPSRIPCVGTPAS